MINNPEEPMAHADFVRNLARSLVIDEHAADDIAQDSLMAALSSSQESVRSIRSWFFKVTQNFSKKTIRNEKRRWRREGVVAIPDSVPSTAEIVEREEIRRNVVNAVMVELDQNLCFQTEFIKVEEGKSIKIKFEPNMLKDLIK